MIKINLLGKKKTATPVPFGLDEKFAKLGIRTDDLGELRPHLIKGGALLAGLYIVNYVPTYFYEQKLNELNQQLNALSEKSSVLEQELASKKDLRKQMEDLNKGEIDLQRQLNAISALQRDRGLAFRSLDAIVVSLPRKVWLTNYAYNERKIVLNGQSWEYFPINEFVKSITESSQNRDIIFRGITTQDSTNPVPGVPAAQQRIKTFDVEYMVRGAGET